MSVSNRGLFEAVENAGRCTLERALNVATVSREDVALIIIVGAPIRPEVDAHSDAVEKARANSGNGFTSAFAIRGPNDRREAMDLRATITVKTRAGIRDNGIRNRTGRRV